MRIGDVIEDGDSVLSEEEFEEADGIWQGQRDMKVSNLVLQATEMRQKCG